MNLIWIAGLAIYVGLEKLVAGTAWLSHSAGAGMIGAGLIVIFRAL